MNAHRESMANLNVRRNELIYMTLEVFGKPVYVPVDDGSFTDDQRRELLEVFNKGKKTMEGDPKCTQEASYEN